MHFVKNHFLQDVHHCFKINKNFIWKKIRHNVGPENSILHFFFTSFCFTICSDVREFLLMVHPPTVTFISASPFITSSTTTLTLQYKLFLPDTFLGFFICFAFSWWIRESFRNKSITQSPCALDYRFLPHLSLQNITFSLHVR